MGKGPYNIMRPLLMASTTSNLNPLPRISPEPLYSTKKSETSGTEINSRNKHSDGQISDGHGRPNATVLLGSIGAR